jgi:hypothetical protein
MRPSAVTWRPSTSTTCRPIAGTRLVVGLARPGSSEQCLGAVARSARMIGAATRSANRVLARLDTPRPIVCRVWRIGLVPGLTRASSGESDFAPGAWRAACGVTLEPVGEPGLGLAEQQVRGRDGRKLGRLRRVGRAGVPFPVT